MEYQDAAVFSMAFFFFFFFFFLLGMSIIFLNKGKTSLSSLVSFAELEP